ncbi:MAG: hypothetical protein K2X71_27430 [Methylobacterium sp.]|uniref:hypothetical protein n=1 Tax=Methylobacterium sp. TaxID=409 RepID=UPI002588D08C|nr:hypothetical protein [Methylobacterium sp.]MBY0299724.1 hypothetical protein [Methylobacterium sp.]
MIQRNRLAGGDPRVHRAGGGVRPAAIVRHTGGHGPQDVALGEGAVEHGRVGEGARDRGAARDQDERDPAPALSNSVEH